jgi:serine/threonine-protein kinase
MAQFQTAVELDEHYVPAHWGLGATMVEQRRYNDAITELRQAVMLSEGSPVLMGQLGRAYALSGATSDANAILRRLTALAAREYVPSSAPALVHLGFGRTSNALDLLSRAYDEHDFALVYLRVAPWFAGIRGDTRYAQLTARMQLQ